jgi:uncharacterized membrane protein
MTYQAILVSTRPDTPAAKSVSSGTPDHDFKSYARADRLVEHIPRLPRIFPGYLGRKLRPVQAGSCDRFTLFGLGHRYKWDHDYRHPLFCNPCRGRINSVLSPAQAVSIRRIRDFEATDFLKLRLGSREEVRNPLEGFMDYIPITLPFFFALWFVVAVLIALVEIGILGYVFESMGISRRYLLALLVFCLLGSYVNIPVAELPAAYMRSGEVVNVFGVKYIIPVMVSAPRTVIAVNLGGAVIPCCLSIYLIVKHGIYYYSFLAVTIVSVLIHMMARPEPGVGIVVPIFIPPLITAFVAVSLSRWFAAPLAYIAGSMGTLIGADLLNLGKVRGLGAPVASIGGAGKFDGIFLTGVVAVLLASLLGARRHMPRR